MALHNVQELHVNKQNLSDTTYHQYDFDDATLTTNQVLLKVQNFGFSANNITYAALGDRMGYWGFFPAAEGYGIIPIWGFAEVVASSHEDIAVGQRVYGYLPLATHLKIEVNKFTDNGFFDTAASRKSINAVYDHYVMVDKDPAYNPAREAWQVNFRPLFMTSFVLGMHVRDNCEQQQVLISSASSKTALGAAHYLSSLPNRTFEVIGLTSDRNADLVKDSGCYDSVVTYSDMASIDPDKSTWLLDFAANGEIHDFLGKHLRTTDNKISLIGATDWSASNKPSMNAPQSTVFFAPSEVQMRTKEMGNQGFLQQYALAWQAFATQIHKMMTETQVDGSDDIQSLYLQTLSNKLDTSSLVLAKF